MSRKIIYMVKDESECDVEVVGSSSHQETVTCVNCPVAEEDRTMSYPQMVDHLVDIHLERGHKVWDGEEGKPGLKKIKEMSEMRKFFESLERIKTA